MSFTNYVTKHPIKSKAIAVSTEYNPVAAAKLIAEVIDLFNREARIDAHLGGWEHVDSFDDTFIECDADGRVRVSFDGCGYERLSAERYFEHEGDVREQIEQAMHSHGLFVEDVNSYCFKVFAQ